MRTNTCTCWPILLGIVSLAGCDNSVGFVPARVIVSPDHASVRLGKAIAFRNRGTGRPTEWRVVEPAGRGIVSSQGRYRAPYFLPNAPIATVEARSGVHTDRAEVTIVDVAPDPVDCTGPGQGVLPGLGEYVFTDELPEAVLKVPPSYPDDAREAGVQGTVMVQALVCSSGLIFDTRVVISIPMLDQAAVDAVRQWVFLPATSAGKPVAVWVAIPVRFTLH